MKHAAMAAAVVTLGGSVLAGPLSCNSERAKECEALTTAVRPLEDAQGGQASAAQVALLKQSVEAVKLEDEPLREFSGKLRSALDVLSGTLAVKASPSPPDGTDDVIRQRLKEARTIRADIGHYCSQ